MQESKLQAARMHIFVRRGGPNYQTGLKKMRALGEELGVPIEVRYLNLQHRSFFRCIRCGNQLLGWIFQGIRVSKVLHFILAGQKICNIGHTLTYALRL